jgi:glycogen debranching enzyme
MIRIDCKESNLLKIDREWLETDGRGGYASSTLTGFHTRRYHGWIVANLPAQGGRHVLLSKLEDSFSVAEKEFFFTHHRYPGTFFPPGPSLLREFILDICPRFSYQADTVSLQKSMMLVYGTGTLLVRYDLDQSPTSGLLRLKPFLAYRGYHTLAHQNPSIRSRTEGLTNGFTIEPYEGMPPLTIRTSVPSRFLPSPIWYNRFEYTEERERGFDWEEDLFLPGSLEVPVEMGGMVILAVSCDSSGEDPVALWDTEILRRREELLDDKRLADQYPSYWPKDTSAETDIPLHTESMDSEKRTSGSVQVEKCNKSKNLWIDKHHCPGTGNELPANGFIGEDRDLFLALLRAGRQFLITTPSGRPAIIAGYPWFGSWGRDTLISLPGLAFCTGRIAEGIEILTEICLHERECILPNFFSANGIPEAYNTVDSSLLYFWAVQELLRVTDDIDLVRSRFWPLIKRIINRFFNGTRFSLGIDAQGLLHAGEEGKALTWMDAVVEGRPVTPRHGYAVEINALWYNALAFATALAERFDDQEGSFADRLPVLRRSFRETFWIPERNCLGDVFHNGVLDRSIRPNQLFAVSLPYSPLNKAEQAGVVRTVREELLTPCGLRTLSPSDPAYRGRYHGNGAERDAAYHQGTVWPWLLGPFGEAALRVAEDREREKESLKRHLRIFLRHHLREAGIGSVSEVFDGDHPHRPGGCIAQAWSIAELIRLYLLLNQ